MEAVKNTGIFNALIAVYVISPLPLGSNRPWAWLFLAGCSFLLLAACAFAWMGGRMALSPTLRGRPAGATVCLLLVVVTWIFCQTVPLPMEWVAVLSPQTFKIYQAARAVVPNDVLSMPLSLDSDASFAAGMRSLFYLALFLLLLQCLDSRLRVKVFCLAIVISGFFQSIYGSFTALSGIAYPFVGQGVATGTFVNRNHLAGYLEMALSLGMVLLLKASRTGSAQAGLRGVLRMVLSEKALVRLMLIMMVAGLILTRSRMGNSAFFSSLLLTGCLSVVASNHFRKKGVILLLLSILMVDVLLLGQWFGLEKVAERLRQTSLETEHRDEVDVYSVPLVQDFWLTGSGAASFVHIFPAYGQDNSGVLYDHAHNDYLEILCELGVIGFVPMCLIVVMGFYQSLLSLQCVSHSHIRAAGFGGCMGISSICIHSSVDFNLQIPANALLFLAIIAIVLVAQHTGKNAESASKQL